MYSLSEITADLDITLYGARLSVDLRVPAVYREIKHNKYARYPRGGRGIARALNKAWSVSIYSARGVVYMINHIAGAHARKLCLLRAVLLPELCALIAGFLIRALIHNIHSCFHDFTDRDYTLAKRAGDTLDFTGA